MDLCILQRCTPPHSFATQCKKSGIGRNFYIANDTNAAYWSRAGLSQIPRGGIGTRNYTAGVSLGYRFVCLDCAFVAMNEETIGNSHKFGVSLHF